MARPPEPRINGRIRAREVRVIVGPTGEQLGILPIAEALSKAEGMDLDLVEVADNANPPVCKIMDYGKFKYENAQRAKESRKKAKTTVVKEMKYRPKIGVGDFETKTRKVESFLNDGNKVKITIMFRGREVTHPELGKKILDDIIARVEHYAQVETYPRLEGRNMTMVVAPLGKKQRRKKPKPVVVETDQPAEKATPAAAAPKSETEAPASESSETPAAEPAE